MCKSPTQLRKAKTGPCTRDNKRYYTREGNIILNTLEKIKAAIKKNQVKHIDLRFTDLFGRWHNITLPASSLSKKLLNDGVGFDGSNFPGLSSIEEGDLSLIPDTSTAFLDPSRENPAITFIGRIVEADTKRPFDRDPRVIAEKADSLLKKHRIADLSMWGPEFEFYVFDEVSVTNENLSYGYGISPSEGLREGVFGLRPGRGYHAIPPEDSLINIRDKITGDLEEIGIMPRYHHHEVGSHGQMEIEIEFLPLVKAGDAGMILKHLVRTTAALNGKIATFMPKPIYGEPGSGMHFHQFLVKNGKSIFYSKRGYGGLSKLADHYIAGLLKHAPALLAFTNPSTNSYKRLVPGFEAPVNSFYSLANRSAAVRIPKYATKADKKRIEFRTPDATCNIYLAMAAQLMAGIDGIRKKLDPGKEGFGPFDINIFDLPEKERQKIKPLPSSLSEALDELEKDHDFLLEGGVFSKGLITDWIDLKRNLEVNRVNSYTQPIEIELYLDC